MNKTLTVNVNTEVERQFRQIAKSRYRGAKGFLGKALTESMKYWTSMQENSDIDAKAILELEKGFRLGKFNINRDELHER